MPLHDHERGRSLDHSVAPYAYYGHGPTPAYVSLSIQHADTLAVIKHHIHCLSDFPEGPEDVAASLRAVVFTWGVHEVFRPEGRQPIRRSPRGVLIPAVHMADTDQPAMVRHATEREH